MTHGFIFSTSLKDGLKKNAILPMVRCAVLTLRSIEPGIAGGRNARAKSHLNYHLVVSQLEGCYSGMESSNFYFLPNRLSEVI